MDITENELYVKSLIRVMMSEHSYGEKTSAVNDRYSDCFAYILGGSCEYTFDSGDCFTVSEGEVLYLAHHSSYKMERGADGYKVIFCDFFFASEERRKSAVYKVRNQSAAENFFKRLYKSYLLQRSESFAERMALLYSIYGETVISSGKEYVGADARGAVGRAKRSIDEGFGNTELSVSYLAASCGFSEVYFRKLFKSIYRVSPLEYIISVRLKNAERLMIHTELSVEECALNSGFASLGYFSRVFKKAYGISPAKYRRENAGEINGNYGV